MFPSFWAHWMTEMYVYTNSKSIAKLVEIKLENQMALAIG